MFAENSRDFTMRIAALADVFGVLATASGVVQNLQVLPWKKLQMFSQIRNNFNMMLQNLSEDSLDKHLWQNTILIGMPNEQQVLF